MEAALKKYPRTPHLEGSRLQPGDEDLSQVPFSAVRGRRLVVEEKIDGANSALSFDENGALLLQSRGHYLTGGWRERHFDLFKQWAGIHRDAFFQVLGSRYIMYGEWMYAKHTVWYDALPHYFMEFDIYDRERGIFLDTPSRRALTGRMPVASVPVLAEERFQEKEALLFHLGDSRYKTRDHLAHLCQAAEREGLDVERVLRETDPSPTMEGLYLKLEADGQVVERFKYVRASFHQRVDQSGSHWLDRPILPNGLCRGMDELFLPELP